MTRWTKRRSSRVDTSTWDAVIGLLNLMLFWRVATSATARFIRQPSNLTVVEGSPEEIMQCHVENTKANLRWSRNYFVLGDLLLPRKIAGSVFSIQPNQPKGVYNLQIQNVSVENDGVYDCQALGSSVKLRSRKAFLNVLVAPKNLSIQPTKNGVVSVKRDEKLSLRCEAGASKPAPSMRWRLGRTNLSPGISTNKVPNSKLILTSSSLELTPSKLQNGTFIQCIAAHPALAEDLVRTAVLNVLYPPEMPTISHDRASTIAGQNISLTCTSVGGNPEASLKWKLGNVVVPTETVTLGNRVYSQLTQKMKPEDDGAVVSCSAESPVLKKPLVVTETISVLHPPEEIIVSQTPEHGVFENGTVTLQCTTSSSNPSPILSWYRGRQLVKTGRGNSRSTENDREPPTNSIVLNHITRKDSETRYDCVAAVPQLRFKNQVSTRINVIYPPSPPDILIYHLDHKYGLEVNGATAVARNLKADHIVRLKCISTGGNPKPRLRWYSDNQLVEDERDHIVHVRSKQAQKCIDDDVTCNVIEIKLRRSDNGRRFECRITHEALEDARRTSVQLKVMFPPSNVSLEMFPTNLRSGHMVRMICNSASSFPSPVITWYRDGLLITPSMARAMNGSISSTSQRGKNYGYTTTSRLVFRALPRYHHSSVVCKATNPDLQQSVDEVAKLDVKFAPQADRSQMHFNGTEGGILEILVPIQANPTPLSFRWWRMLSGNGLNESPRYRDAFDPYFTARWEKRPLLVNERISWSSVEGVLRIVDVRRSDSGVYKVDVKNSMGSTEVIVVVEVLYPAKIVKLSGPAEVQEGEEATFTCDFETHPHTHAVVTWAKEIPTTGRKIYESFTQKRRSTLHLTNVTATDRGNYRCSAYNGVGQIAVKNIRLSVKFGARIDRAKSTHKVARQPPNGGPISAALVCTAAGNPHVEFDWKFKNGSKILFGGSDVSERRYVKDEASFADDVYKSRMFISTKRTHIDEDIISLYYCSVSNAIGEDQMKMLVVPRGAPEPPYDVKVENATDTAFFISWHPGFDGGQPQSFVVQYRTFSDKKYNTNDKERWIDVSIRNRQAFCTIENLQPDSTYSIRIRSVNELGQSKPSHSVRAKTMRSALQSSDTADYGLTVSLIPVIGAVGGILIITVVLLFVLVPRIRRRFVFKPRSVNTESEGLATPNESLAGNEAEREVLTSQRRVSYVSGSDASGLGASMRSDGNAHPSNDRALKYEGQSHKYDFRLPPSDYRVSYRDEGIERACSDIGSLMYARSCSYNDKLCCCNCTTDKRSSASLWHSHDVCGSEQNNKRFSAFYVNATDSSKYGTVPRHYHTETPSKCQPCVPQGKVPHIGGTSDDGNGSECFCSEICCSKKNRKSLSSSFQQKQNPDHSAACAALAMGSDDNSLYAVDVTAPNSHSSQNPLKESHGLYVLGISNVDRQKQRQEDIMAKHVVPLSVREGSIAPPGIRNSWISSSSSISNFSDQKILVNQQQFIEMIERGNSPEENQNERVVETPPSDHPVSISTSSLASSTRPLLKKQYKRESYRCGDIAPLPPSAFQDGQRLDNVQSAAYSTENNAESGPFFRCSRHDDDEHTESTAFLGVDDDGTLFV